MKRRKRRGTALAWVLLAAALAIMALSGYHLLEIRRTYQEGNQSYVALTDRVRPAGNSAFYMPAAEGLTPDEAIGGPALDMGIDFAALRKINPDAAAWLYCPDTVIDYPVLRTADYDYYLHRLPDGTINANGTLFVDYNNAAEFTDRLTVIYGHNMRSGRMFGSLTGYKAQEYYDAHPYFYLNTAGGANYRIDLAYGCVIGAGQWVERGFMYEENLSAFLAYAAENTTFTSPAQYTSADRFVILSTCSYEFNDARYVVAGVLRPARAEQNQ
ncbi:MAG: class B sortase [Christensenellaceae bacterium]|jgi:sortase B|nr:class B sortase [Christensenellaceae bacterium]